MAGVQIAPSYWDQPVKKLPPTSVFGNPGTFTAAADTQASDYDKIMSQYADLAKSYASNPIGTSPIATQQVAAPNQVNYNQITPQTSNYEQSEDVTGSLAGLSDLATTGGYSDQGINDIRARSISPIRSIYANARQNAERQRSLAGGYSPNFNAVQAQMARDESNQIGDITTNVNAGIAQNVAANRLSAAPAYASASANANAAKTAADQRNAEIINQINQANSQGSFQANRFNVDASNANNENNANRAFSTQTFNTQAALDAAKANKGGIFGAIEGQRSLYGTTPALTNTFGNQVVQASQLGQGQQNLNTQRLNTIGSLAR